MSDYSGASALGVSTHQQDGSGEIDVGGFAGSSDAFIPASESGLTNNLEFWRLVSQGRARVDVASPDITTFVIPERKALSAVSNVVLLPTWYALATSKLSSRTFGRLQGATAKFIESANAEGTNTLHAALRLFLKFWASAKESSAEPELYILTNGRLQALWSHKAGHFLVIEFVGNAKVYWAVNEADRLTEGEVAAGKIEDLARDLRSFGSKPLKWRC